MYEEAKHDPPKVILGRLKDLEREIAADIRKREGMLRAEQSGFWLALWSG